MIKKGNLKWTNEEISLLKENYSKLHPDKTLKLLPNRTWNAIKLRASLLGLRCDFLYHRKAKLKNLLEDTPQAYYWCGFLMADGIIRHDTKRIAIGLSNKDKEHLVRYCDFIQHKGISIYENCCHIQAQDKLIVPQIIKKFDFKPRKTYNPPDLDKLTDKVFINFIIGLIDGDGSFSKRENGNDYALRIKLHGSWLSELKKIETRLYEILKVEPYRNVCRTRLGKKGYARVCLSDSRLLKRLKRVAIENDLPILKRKWDVVNLDFVGRAEASLERKEIIKRYLEEGKNIQEIVQKTNLKYNTVYRIIRRINL